MKIPTDCILVNKEVLQHLLDGQRRDIQIKICSAREAKKILGVNSRKFMELTQDSNSRIKPTKIKGKYSLDSIYREAERLIK